MAVLIRLCLVILLLSRAWSAAAEELQLGEQQIKVALLYNFLKYTDWPESALQGSRVTVCVFGSDPFDGHLGPMAGRTVNRHEIAIRLLHTIADAGNCQLLFVNRDESSRWPELKAFLKDRSVLTVSDYAGFGGTGGMIEFGHKNDHISAELNMNAVTMAHLSVEDRLLKLVTVAHPGGETP